MAALRRNKQISNKFKLSSSLQSKRLVNKSPHFIPSSHDIEEGELWINLKTIYNLNDKVLSETIDGVDLHAALRILHQIQANLADCKYGANKKLMYLHHAVFYNNKAFVLSQLQYDQESAKMMEKSLKNYEYVQAMLSSKEDKVAYSAQYIKLSLKYCAILSHSQKHLEAVSIAQKILIRIQECLLLLNEICHEHRQWSIDTPQTIATETDSRVKSQRVNFRRIVLKQSEKILRSIEELPSPKRLLGELRQHFEQKMKNMYFWKDNAENNAKNLKKQLFYRNNNTGERNLLGLQKSSTFIDEFSLSEVMSLDLLTMKAKINTDPFYLLSSAKIVQLVLLASICYFTIATETRFNDGNLDVGSLKINQRYRKLNKDQNLRNCKILHLKAIQLAGKHLSMDNDFFVHLMNSFNKNYKCVLDQISQQSQISRKSISNEINETYYHKINDFTQLDEPTINQTHHKRRKERVTSKDKVLLKKKGSESQRKLRLTSKTKRQG